MAMDCATAVVLSAAFVAAIVFKSELDTTAPDTAATIFDEVTTWADCNDATAELTAVKLD